MEHKFKEIWNNLTMFSKIGIALIYCISSFPVLLSKENPDVWTFSFFWFGLIQFLNSFILIWFINKIGLKWYHLNFLLILLATTLVLENPEILLLRMLLSLSLAFLIVEVIIILPTILLISLANFVEDKKRGNWKRIFVKNQK